MVSMKLKINLMDGFVSRDIVLLLYFDTILFILKLN